MFKTRVLSLYLLCIGWHWPSDDGASLRRALFQETWKTLLMLLLCACAAYSPRPDSGESKRPADKDPSSWGVEEVVWFIKDADPQALGPHAEAFRKHVGPMIVSVRLMKAQLLSQPTVREIPQISNCAHINLLCDSSGYICPTPNPPAVLNINQPTWKPNERYYNIFKA